MKKTKKIWLWIFLAMFAIPEILWGNLIKILELPIIPAYRDVQYFSDNPSIAFLLITVEIIGVSGVIYFLNKKNVNINLKLKYIFNILLVIILVMLVASLFFSYGMSQINFF